MFILLLRTAILFIIVVFTMRMMGKRQIGQLEPFELVIAIMISDLATMPMQDTRIPLLHGVIPIITLLILQITMSVLQLKSEKMKDIISGKPTILIKKGQLQMEQLKSQRLSASELLEEMRLKGYLNIADIEYATLETNGQISIIPKTELAPASKKDMNVKLTQETMPIILVNRGKLLYENINRANKDENWIMNELKKNKVKSLNDLEIGVLDSQNKFFYQTKKDPSGK
jgi:uncharacterized membrane protein YcaP (DUF421 family)